MMKTCKVKLPEYLITRNIVGFDITLVEGIRYRASRPMISTMPRTTFPVTIKAIGNEASDPDVVINGLSYEEANELVNAFNNGVSSFEGRVW